MNFDLSMASTTGNAVTSPVGVTSGGTFLSISTHATKSRFLHSFVSKRHLKAAVKVAVRRSEPLLWISAGSESER